VIIEQLSGLYLVLVMVFSTESYPDFSLDHFPQPEKGLCKLKKKTVVRFKTDLWEYKSIGQGGR